MSADHALTWARSKTCPSAYIVWHALMMGLGGYIPRSAYYSAVSVIAFTSTACKDLYESGGVRALAQVVALGLPVPSADVVRAAPPPCMPISFAEGVAQYCGMAELVLNLWRQLGR